jgi:hypothetical protein
MIWRSLLLMFSIWDLWMSLVCANGFYVEYCYTENFVLTEQNLKLLKSKYQIISFLYKTNFFG